MAAVGTILFGFFGLLVLLSIAWLFSAGKRQIDWRLVGTGVFLQIVFAMLVLMVPGGRDVFDALSHGFVNILAYVAEGTQFIFGPIGDERLFGSAIAAGQGETAPDAFKKYGFIFAVQVLPTIIFFAALMGVLYHLGVMQFLVRIIAMGITKVMRVSGAETTSVCASIFIGQTEAPLTIKPYLSSMTKSELLTVMIGGMAHIAGGVLAAYVMLLGGGDPEQQAYYAKHLLTASIMAAPATLVIAKMLMPETGQPVTLGKVRMQVEKTTVNVIDAAASGAAEGLKLALNVGAMLLAFVALIALLNAPLTWLGEITGLAGWLGKPTDMSTLLGYLLAPVAWVIGVPWQDAETVGALIGEKIVVNEFVAYLCLSQIQDSLSEHGRLVATYALCGFANFSSIAIQIGGIGGLAPDRRGDLARFGLRAVLGGTLATLMTARIAGVISQF